MAQPSPSRLRVDLAYDGAPFHGFARQPDLPTVQGSLEATLARVLGQQVETTAAGRTDRGVHASAQVVHLDIDPAVPAAARFLADLDRARWRLDRLLGPAITVWAVRRVTPDFDARFSAVFRRYRYRIVEAPALHPLRRFDVWHLGEPLDVGVMRTAARHLIGEHDFASFCRPPPSGSTTRRVDALAVVASADALSVRVQGPAFCHQQVRAMVAVLVEVGRGRRPPDWSRSVLAAGDRAAAPALAPAHGLTLEAVGYGPRFPSAPPPVGG